MLINAVLLHYPLDIDFRVLTTRYIFLFRCCFFEVHNSYLYIKELRYLYANHMLLILILLFKINLKWSKHLSRPGCLGARWAAYRCWVIVWTTEWVVGQWIVAQTAGRAVGWWVRPVEPWNKGVEQGSGLDEGMDKSDKGMGESNNETGKLADRVGPLGDEEQVGPEGKNLGRWLERTSYIQGDKSINGLRCLWATSVS